jgi:hypothetical protein
MKGWRWLVWTSTVSSLAMACGGGPSAPGAANKVAPGGQPAAAKAAAQKPALPTVKPKISEPGPPLPPLTYEAKGRRDPFVPVQLPKEQTGGLDVSTLKLVGIISGRQLLALVEAPNGLGYVLKPGDGLGNGHLTEIGAESITFAVGGRQSPRESSLTLKLRRD